MARKSAWGQMILDRMDQWAEEGSFLPTSDHNLPNGVFWLIFGWNFPILFVMVALVFIVVDKANQLSGQGAIFSFSSVSEVAQAGAAVALVVGVADMWACLSIRSHWNRRARQIRTELEATPYA